MRLEGEPRGHGEEKDWKGIVLERFAIEIFSKDLDRNVSMS